MKRFSIQFDPDSSRKNEYSSSRKCFDIPDQPKIIKETRSSDPIKEDMTQKESVSFSFRRPNRFNVDFRNSLDFLRKETTVHEQENGAQ